MAVNAWLSPDHRILEIKALSPALPCQLSVQDHGEDPSGWLITHSGLTIGVSNLSKSGSPKPRSPSDKTGSIGSGPAQNIGRSSTETATSPPAGVSAVQPSTSELTARRQFRGYTTSRRGRLDIDHSLAPYVDTICEGDITRQLSGLFKK
jgi:hypothetical protein